MRVLVALVTAGIAIACTAGNAVAANCKKGQPCGNSCISWNKVCRIGASAPAYNAGSRPAGLMASPSSGSNQRRNAPAVWIGLKANMRFYRPDCAFVREFSSDQRAYFDNEANARAAGYQLAGNDGCPM